MLQVETIIHVEQCIGIAHQNPDLLPWYKSCVYFPSFKSCCLDQPPLLISYIIIRSKHILVSQKTISNPLKLSQIASENNAYSNAVAWYLGVLALFTTVVQ